MLKPLNYILFILVVKIRVLVTATSFYIIESMYERKHTIRGQHRNCYINMRVKSDFSYTTLSVTGVLRVDL